MEIIDKIRYISNYAWEDNGVDISAYAYDRLKENGFEKAISPYNIGLKITDKCNFDCVNCFVKKSDNDMSLELVKHLIHILPSKPYSVYLTGGDPFLNNNIFEIINFLYQENIKIKIHSTGILSSNNISELVKHQHKIDSIQISIDSINEYDKMRPSKIQDPLNHVSEFINLLINNVNLSVNFVLSSDNKGCIQDVIDYCNDNSIKNLSIAPVITSKTKKIVTDKDNLDFFYETTKYAVSKGIKLKQEPYSHPWSIKHYFGFTDEFGDAEHFCPAQKTELEVDMYGDVYPCPFLHDKNHKMGNILNDEFDEIWNSGCKELNNMQWSTNKLCLKCEVYKLCGGGCYAAATKFSSNFDERCCLQNGL